MKVIRQNVGIDIAKDSFVSTVTFLEKGQIVRHVSTKQFSNNHGGFCEFRKWCLALCVECVAISFTMEATGVYYESLAYYLEGEGSIIHVLLPNKVKKYAASFNIKSKTDKIDSKILGQMGVERVLDTWKLSSKFYRHLRTLSRERQQIVVERTRIKNQLHAEEHCGDPIKTTMRRMKNRIKYLNKQIDAIENELANIIAKDDCLSEKVKKITSVPGLGFKTVVTVIAETQGFVNITSIRQLNSYAGYDISLKESGKWKGKARISKKGNSHIRQAMYMPSWSSIKYTTTYKTFYERLNERKGNGLIAGTAVQRKLLGLIYTLWKNDTEYIDDYEIKKVS
jgi:transposase